LRRCATSCGCASNSCASAAAISSVSRRRWSNIKLDSVIADIIGLSGRRMIEALIGGETDPQALAALAHRRIKATSAELEAALRGRVTKHHRFALRLLFQHIDAIDAAITEIDQEVDANIEPFRTAITILSTIPGVSQLSAEVIAAEIGVDRGRFPTEGHLISWAGLCPKNDESAGKRRCTRMRKGAPWPERKRERDDEGDQTYEREEPGSP
jgi:transposase